MRAFGGEGEHPSVSLKFYRDDQVFHMVPSVDLEEQCESRKRPQASALINYFAESFSALRLSDLRLMGSVSHGAGSNE